MMGKSRSFLGALASRLQSLRSAKKVEKPLFFIEELDQRVLYSADDPFTAAVQSLENNAQAVVRVVAVADPTASTTPGVRAPLASPKGDVELVIIDERVDQIEVLKADFQAQIDAGRSINVIVLGRDVDLFATVSNQLREITSAGQNVSALHFIGHGDAEHMQLGSQNLNSQSLEFSAQTVSSWRGAFTAGADILLYGCEFAQTDAGKSLALRLSDLTQTDVAASTNLTGFGVSGGDWSLEYSTGLIEASLVVSLDGQARYEGVLALTTVGGETKVNVTTVGAQTTAQSVNSVAVANNGDFVVAYTDPANSNDVMVQRYSAAGVAQGGNVVVNTTTGVSAQQNATVAIDSVTGDFIVAWDGNGTGDSSGVFYRRFNAAGTALDATEIRANAVTTGLQSNAVIAMNSVNNFYLAWNDSFQDGSLGGVYARSFNASGAIGAGEVRVNTTTAGAQANPSIATAPGQGVVIAWQSDAQDGSSNGVYFRLFDSTLTTASAESKVNTITAGNQERPSIDMNASGNFVVAWQSPSLGADVLNGIAVQRYSATGVAIGTNIGPVNTALASNQDRANVALADDDSFIVSWVSNAQDTATSVGVYGQAFKANGTFDGAEFRINTTVTNDQSNVSLGYNGKTAVAVWSGEGTGDLIANGGGVFFQRYIRPNILVTTSGTTTTELLATTSFSVVLSAAPSANVTVAVSSSDTTEGTVSTSLLTFTPLNWSTAQVVTVTGVNDRFVDGNIGYTVVLNAAVSADARYSGINPTDLAFINTDDDVINTLVVDSVTDLSDGVVTSIEALYNNKGPDGFISLREAIQAANNTVNGPGGADRIEFNIAGAGVKVISPLTALPQVTGINGAVVIDGYTQPGANIGNLLAGTPHTLMIVLDGSLDVTSAIAGLDIRSDGVTVRGLNIRGWNAAPSSSAIRIESAQNTLIEGNYLGTNVGGTSALANSFAGINMVNASLSLIRNNLVAGNTQFGISLSGAATSSNLIVSNLIGTDRTGLLNLANGSAGITFNSGAQNNLIGGVSASSANVIAFNGVGLSVIDGTKNSLLGNRVFSNSGLGIDLGAVGVTVNDVADADVGANDLQNAPDLMRVQRVGADLLVDAQMISAQANTTFRIELFANPANAADFSGRGEGTTFLGFLTVTTNSSGDAVISGSLLGVAALAPTGAIISATATRDLGGGNYGSTSEFALNTVVVSAPAIAVPVIWSTVAPAIAEGGSGLLSGISVSDADGDLSSVKVSVTSGQLLVNLAGGAVISQGLNSSATLTLSGNQSQINLALATLSYQALGNFNGLDTLSIVAKDAIALSTTTNVALNITAVNTAPTISAPSAVQAIIAGVPKIFKIANGNAIQITDVDAGGAPIEVTLSAGSFSTVTLASLVGLTFTVGDGTSDASMQFRGTLVNVNAALEGLAFSTQSGTFADPSLLIGVNDLGNTGAGTALTSTATVAFKAFGIETGGVGPRITTEAGGTYTLGVILRNAPTADVTVSVVVSPPSGFSVLEASLSTSTLTFTAANWNVYQNIIVTGLDDSLLDGDRTYLVTLGSPTSADANYNAGAPTALSFINTDNDASSTIQVTTASDVFDGNVSSLSALLSDKGTDGLISLREAIAAANSTANGSVVDRITFNIAGSGPHVISFGTGGLPIISDAVFIDGTSEPDYATNGNSPVIVLEGLSAGATASGISLAATASGSTIQGLLIRNFSQNGVLIQSGSNGNAILSNIVQGNLGAGVRVVGIAQNNSILANVIQSNGGLGIDLGALGVTLNDPVLDSDSGANGLQNFPVLTTATASTNGTNITGTLNSAANTNYRIQYFRVVNADSSGYGEAGQYVGFVDVTTNAAGAAAFNTSSLIVIAAGERVTATATRMVGMSTFETSEFAQNILALAPGVTVTPISGTTTSEAGGAATFSLVLNAAPTSNVTINLSVADGSEAVLSISSVNFTAANWQTPVVVTVTGVDDSFVDGNIAYSVVTSSAVSLDANYSDLAVADLVLNNIDDDTVNELVVNTLSDIADGNITSIAALMADLGPDGKLSLREAILASNATVNGSGGPDIIRFDLGGSGFRAINLLSALPTVSDTLMIDGRSLAGFAAGSNMVSLNGASAGVGVNGVSIASSYGTFVGLRFSNFTGAGISVLSGDSNDFQDNIFVGNTGISIDLGGNGITPNDVLDIDTGANNLQNSPTIVLASTNGTTLVVAGQIRSEANSFYRIELVASPTAHASGTGQASIILGIVNASTDASGFASFSQSFATAIPVGYVISGTATLSSADFSATTETSEFGLGKAAVDALLIYADPNPAGYTEAAPSIAPLLNLLLVDASSNSIESASVKIVSGFQNGADVLTWTSTPNITGSYDSSSGVFSLLANSGTASLAEYTTALNSLRFVNTSNNPSTVVRQIEVTVVSGLRTASGLYSLNVNAVNDAPYVPTNTGLLVAEGGSNLITSTSLTANDVDIANRRNLVYQLATTPTGGVLWRGATALSVNGQFTQGDIDDGLVQYVHGGGEISTDSFTFRVSDGMLQTGLQTFSIAVSPVNDAPTASVSGGSITYVENNLGIRPMQFIVLTDVDNLTLAGASITLTNPEVADILGFTNQNGITGVFNNLTKTLTLSGSASVANYQTAIASVTYRNSSDRLQQLSKNFTVQVTDDAGVGSLTSVSILKQIVLVNVNDTPLVATNLITNVDEGTALTILNTRLRFNDPDNTASEIIYTITSGQGPTRGQLELSGNPGVSITSFTQDDINNSRLIYKHDGSESPNSDSFTFIVTDGGGVNSPATTFLLNVIPVDDLAKIQLPTGTVVFIEDAGLVSVATGVVLSDADNTTLTQIDIRLTSGYRSTEDLLQLTGAVPGGITASWNSAAGRLSLIAPSGPGFASIADFQQALTQVQYSNSSQSPNTAPRTLVFTLYNKLSNPVGNPGGFQINTNRQLTVTSVNDAPTLSVASTNYTLTEDATLTLAGSNAPVISDVDAGTNVVQVTIYSLQAGTGASLRLAQLTGLTFQTGTGLNDDLMVFTGTVASINSALNGLSYRAGLNYVGADSILIEVSDLGNTGGGGTKIATKLLALTITPVNDAPVPTGSLSTGLLVGGSVTLNPLTIGATDVDNALSALTFRVTQTPLNGFLERVGSPGVNVATFTAADITSGAIRYVHNGITAGLDEFQFDVFDGAIYSTTGRFELLVAAPTVPPQLNPIANSAITYTEQASPVVLAPNVSITVVDSLLLLGATVRISSGGDLLTDRLIFVDQNNIRGSIDAFGVLTLSGIDTPQNYQTAIRSVQFESSSDTPSVAIRTIEFSVKDGSNSSNISRVQLNILSVNDAPDVTASIGARTLEDVAYSNQGSIFVSDVDTPSSALLTVTLSSSRGVITLRTVAGISFLAGSAPVGAAMTFTGTTADVNAALADFEFKGLSNFNGVAQINIAVTDSGDANGLNKLTRAGVLQITVDPVNDAPVLLNPTIGNVIFSEGGADVAVIPALSLTDIDSPILSSAKVTIGAGYIPAQDRLTIANSQGLSVTWDNATGTLSIIGDASSSVYESVLRSVSYQNISQSVTVGFRTISFFVSDPALESSSLSRVVEVTPVNDPPVLDVGAMTNFTENSAAVVVAPSLSISDIDSAFLSGARWTISGSYLSGSDVLQFTNTALITGVWNIANATLTLTGVATVSEYESALRQVTFLTTTDNPIAPTRDFTLQVTDSGGVQAVTSLNGFAVNAVNDAPVVSLAANIAATEDINLAIFSNVVATSLKDVDANQQMLTFTVDVNRGTLQLPVGTDVASAQGSGSAQLTVVGTLLQLTTLLGQVTYAPELNFNGSVQLQITLQDQFGLRDLKSAQIQIAAVNDAPTLIATNTTLAVVNSGSANDLFSTAVLRDVDSPLLDSAVVKIAANYAAGDRISVTSIAKVTSAWDAATGTLTLTGAASASEYEAILQTLQFSTTSLSLNERSISLALKDAGGAAAAVSRNVTVSNSVVDPKNTTPTPNKNVPTTTDTGVPTITSASNAPTTTQTAAGTSAAPVASSTGQQGAGLSGTRLAGASSGGAFAEKDSTSSGQSEDSVFARERANRNGGAVVRVGGQSLNSLEAAIVKISTSATASVRDGDSDLRGVLSSARIAETRGVDIGARLLQIANRDSAQVASNASLLLTVAGPDVDDEVNIKVSKADQLAVDLLALPVQSGGVVISAAVLWWITRAGGLLTALLTSLPSWQHFDPLPILTSTDGRPEDDWGEENEEDDRELDAVLNQ
jgi:hypothetical protein